jgi:hypothetical protein
MSRTTFSGPVKSLNGFEGDFTGGTENLELTGFLTVDGNATVGGDLDVASGDVTASTGTIDIFNATTVTVSDGTTTDDLTATGVVTFSGSSATISGNASLLGTANVIIIPTSDPAVAGAIWNDAGTLKISAGA